MKESTYILCATFGKELLAKWSVKDQSDINNINRMLKNDYLLYGNIYDSGDKKIAAFVNLYSNGSKKDFELINLVDDYADHDEFVVKLAKLIDEKIENKIKEINRKKENVPSIGITNSIGYHIPMGKWWDVMTGIINFESGFKILDIQSMYKNKYFKFNLQPGLSVSYSLAINKTGFADSKYNSLCFKLPLDFSFLIALRHETFVSVAPQFQLDILYREHPDPVLYSYAFSLSLSAGYRYWFGKYSTFGLGVNNVFDMTFYDNFYAAYKLQIMTTVRIGLARKDHRK
jgi:hypothetical protein